MKPLLRTLAFLASVEAVALLRTGYGLGFAVLLGLMLTAKVLVCAWRLPLTAPHTLLMTYAVLAVLLSSCATLLRTINGTTRDMRDSGHSWLWKLGMSTKTMMLVVEPLLTLGMASGILVWGQDGAGLMPLPWPLSALQPVLDAEPMPHATRVWLRVWGHHLATAQAVLLPVGLWLHNKTEYDTFPADLAPPTATTRPTDTLTWHPVTAAPPPTGLAVPSAAHLAATLAQRATTP